MPTHHIQTSFAAGELAPTLQHRVDLQRYAIGLKTCRNCFIHVHGGASNRAGFRFIAKAKYADRKFRPVRFEFSTTQAYIIEVGHLYMRFYKDGGQIVKTDPAVWATPQSYAVGDFVVGPNDGLTYYCIVAHTSNAVFNLDLSNQKWAQQAVYEIPTTYTEAEIGDLRFAQSGDVLYVAHPNHAPAELTRLAHDSWTLSAYLFSAGPFMLSNSGTTTLKLTDATHMLASAALFNSGHVGAFYRLTHEVADQTVRNTFSAANNFGTSVRAGSTWRFFSTGTWQGQVVIQKSTDNGATWKTIRQINDNLDTSGDTGEESCLIRAGVLPNTGNPTPGDPPAWSGSITVDLSADPSTWNGIVKITSVTDSTHAVVTITQAVAFRSDDASTANQAKAATDDWAEGSWSTYRGFPSTVAFAYDRLFWASTKTEPQTLWASETSNYPSFARHQPLEDSDGISIQLVSQTVNAVRHLVALSDLLAITSTEDWIIRGSDGTFTPTTVQSKPQGYRGASAVAPIIIGNRVVLIEPKGRVVRDMGFDFSVDGYTGENISVMSNHLFLNHTITDMAYSQEPDSLAWLTRDDGALISLTYLKEQEVLAWARHDTDGKFEGVETIPGESVDEVWVAVKRNGERFMERLDPRMESDDPDDQFFLDAGLSFDNPMAIEGITQALAAVVTAPSHGFSNGDFVEIRRVLGMTELNHLRFIVANSTVNTFSLKNVDTGVDIDSRHFGAYDAGGEARGIVSAVTGLDHLNGRTVSVLANGIVQGQKLVVNGSIDLDTSASTVHVGLPYTAEIETLNLEITQQDGTMQGRKVKISEVVIMVEKTLGCKLSPSDGSVEDEFIFRSTDSNFGQQVALQTGQKIQDFQGGWEDSANIRIVQRDPLPMSIVGIIPRVTPGEG